MTVFSYPQTLFVFELNFLDQALSHCWYLYTTWPMPVLELAERGPYGKNLNKDMWFQLQLHHNTWTRINIHTETFRNAWGEDPSALPCTNTASEVYTSCTPLTGLSLSAAKPHSISLSPRTILLWSILEHFYWSFCTTELSMCQDEEDSRVESLQQSLQDLVQIALCGCFCHVG